MAWLAPPIHGVVALTRSNDRVKAYLGNEADHFFTSAFLLVGLLSVLAVVAAVLLWQWRAHRGPVILAALCVGSVAASAATVGVGALAVRWRYGSIDVASTVGKGTTFTVTLPVENADEAVVAADEPAA